MPITPGTRHMPHPGPLHNLHDSKVFLCISITFLLSRRTWLIQWSTNRPTLVVGCYPLPIQWVFLFHIRILHPMFLIVPAHHLLLWLPFGIPDCYRFPSCWELSLPTFATSSELAYVSVLALLLLLRAVLVWTCTQICNFCSFWQLSVQWLLFPKVFIVSYSDIINGDGQKHTFLVMGLCLCFFTGLVSIFGTYFLSLNKDWMIIWHIFIG